MGNEKKRSRIDEDKELVVSALDGDNTAFAKLMSRYWDSIYHRMLKMVNNKNDAEDLTMEAFSKSFLNLPLYSEEYAFSTWLYRVASNNCIDFLRKQKGVHYSIDQSDDDELEMQSIVLSTESLNPEEKLIQSQRAKAVRGLIGKLNPHYQELIELRYFKEYSYEEISKALDLPLGTIKVQLFRARNMLHKMVIETNVKDD